MKEILINSTGLKKEVTKSCLSNKSMKDMIDFEMTVLSIVSIYDDETDEYLTVFKTEEHGYIGTLSEKTAKDVAPMMVQLLEDEPFKMKPLMITTKNNRDFITYEIL